MNWSTERWTTIEWLFHEATSLSGPAQVAFLDSACGSDAELRRSIERLLRADDGPSDDVFNLGAIEAMRAHDPMLGRRLGPFCVEQKIADGGMGSVYRARRVVGGFEQTVAIKLLRHGTGTQATRAHFLRERQTLAGLSHPHIARLIDGGESEDGRLYFAMELIDGMPVDRFCDERGIDRRGRLRLFATVCRAVHFAHQRLVIHLDLKPGNILVDVDGNPKLLDFGVAGLLGASVDDAGAAPHKRPLTVGYAAPEQLRGEPISVATDVFALGAVLCELLTGCRRLEGETIQQPAADSEEGGRIDGDLGHIARRAKRPEPERRYASAQEFADDVERYLRGFPVTARDAGTLYRCLRFVARNRLASAALVLVPVVLSVALVFTTAAAREARREMEHATIEATSSRALASFLGDTFLGADRVDDERQREDLRRVVLRRADQVRRQYARDAHIRANLLDAFGRVCTELRYFDDADTLLTDARDTRVRAFGRDSLEYALSLTGLGRLRFAEGRFGEAAGLLQESYRLHSESTSDVHRDVAAAANDLATAERALGHNQRALDLHHEALELREAAFGRESALVAESLNNIATAETDPERAEPAMTEALGIRERVLGPDDPLTLQSRINLARLVLARGDLERAQELLVASAESARRIGGPGQESFLQCTLSLAFVHLRLGHIEEAEATTDEAIRATRSRFGADHLRLAPCLEVRAKVLEARADFEGACPLWEEVARIRRLGLPPDHPDLANAMCSLGAAQARSGRTTEAVASLRSAVSIHERGRPVRAFDLLQARINLADALERVGDLEESEQTWLRAWSDRDGDARGKRLTPWLRDRIVAFYRAAGRDGDAKRFAEGQD